MAPDWCDVTALTLRQREVLTYIVERAVSLEPATFRETARHFGFASTNAVNDFAVALKRKGYLKDGTVKSLAGRSRFMLPTPAGYRIAGYKQCDHCGAVS